MEISENIAAMRWLTAELADLAKYGNGSNLEIEGLIQLIDRRIDRIANLLDRS